MSVGLVKRLMSGAVAGDIVDTSQYDGMFGVVTESVMMQQEIALLEGIYKTDRECACADLVGSVKAVTEGIDGQVVMENIITSGIAKLKQYWLKFYAAAKKFFAHVIDSIKALFMESKKFANTYGNQIITKIGTVKKIDVTVWDYDMAAGDKLVDGYLTSIKDEAETKGVSKIGEMVTTDFGKEEFNAEEAFEDFLGRLDQGASSTSDIAETIQNAYHNGDSDKSKEEWETAEVKAAVEVLKTCDKTISTFDKAWKTQEKIIKDIIKQLDKEGKKSADKTTVDATGNKSERDKNEVDAENNNYATARRASEYTSKLLTLGRQLVSSRSEYHKARCKEYTAILKSFFMFKANKKPAQEGMVFEGAEEFDFDMSDVSENAIRGASSPEGIASDMGIALEGYGDEGGLMAEAYRMLGL